MKEKRRADKQQELERRLENKRFEMERALELGKSVDDLRLKDLQVKDIYFVKSI